jgi:hypothetical protein
VERPKSLNCVLSNHGNTLRIASIAFKDENRCFGKNPLLVRLSGVFCTTKGGQSGGEPSYTTFVYEDKPAIMVFALEDI